MKIKQCIILAGGLGTRLGNITQKTPKPLLKIKGKPFIFYLIEKLKNEGIKKIIILVWNMSNKFVKINFSKKFGIDIKIIKEKNKLGTGGSVINSYKYLDSKFFLVNGDTLYDIPFNDLEAKFLNHKEANIITACHYSRKAKNKYKYFFGKKNKLLEYDISKNQNNWISGGTYIISKKILKKFKIKNIDLDSEIISEQFKKGKVAAKKYYNNFIDIGTKSDFIKAESIIKKIMRKNNYEV